MPFSNLELNEWHRKVDNLVLQDFDDAGLQISSCLSPASEIHAMSASRTKSFRRDGDTIQIIFGGSSNRDSPRSAGSRSSPGAASSLSAFGVSGVQGAIGVADDSRIEGGARATSLTTPTIMRRPSAGKPVRYSALEIDSDDDDAVRAKINRDPHDENFLDKIRRARITATPPKGRRRKRAISGAVIGASSGKEHFMKARKGISRGDLVKVREEDTCKWKVTILRTILSNPTRK